MSHFSKADLSKYFYYISGKKEKRKFLVDKWKRTKIEKLVEFEDTKFWARSKLNIPPITKKVNVNYQGRLFLS